MDLRILYEDKDIVAINKPAGLVVHFDGKTKEENVSDWVLKKFPDSIDVGEPILLSNGEKIMRPGIVHRIDRDTSGVLLIAKTKEGFENLKKQFQDREMVKTYHAFVYGEIKESVGTIDRPIGRSKSDFRKWSAQRGARGEMRDAVTCFKVLGKNLNTTFVEVKPKTGRTHQIRVHFKAVSHPIVCDKLYAEKMEPRLGFKRLALHASSIEFKNVLGESVRVEAPFPEDFKRAIDEISDKR